MLSLDNAIQPKHRNCICSVRRSDTSDRNIAEKNFRIGLQRCVSGDFDGALTHQCFVLHPRDHFLPDETAFGKGHAIEQIEIGFMRISIAEFVVFATFGNSVFNAKCVVGEARITLRFCAIGRQKIFMGAGQKS